MVTSKSAIADTPMPDLEPIFLATRPPKRKPKEFTPINTVL
ncbi:hypothetical protein [Lactobacillus sp. W8093]|nr:hypothetical protein [Lactobacillus sp. W8093]